MERDGVADDRQAEPRAAHLARTPFVDAVEPLEQGGQVLLRDADAVVGEQESIGVGRLVHKPDQNISSARIGGGVVGEVAENGFEQPGVAPDNNGPVAQLAMDAQPPFEGQQGDVGGDVAQEGPDLYRLGEPDQLPPRPAG